MKTILIIEDDTMLKENTKELLELENYSVITAPNGKIGILKATNELPDLIICDIMMPEVDGYGVLQALSSNEATIHIPFIFVSAKTEHIEIRKGMDLGADDYLTKPFEEDEFLSAIKSRLAKATILANRRVLKENTAEEKILNLHQLKNFFDDNGALLKYKKREVIFKEGQYDDKVYLILKGTVKVYTSDKNGKELTTALRKADDFLGITSLKETILHKEFATAIDNVELAAIAKKELVDIVDKNHNIALDLMNIINYHLADTKMQLFQTAYSSVRKKTVQTLMQFAEVLNKQPGEAIKVSRSDLASVAGVAPESLIRTLSSLKHEGLLEIKGGVIKILNVEKLKKIE